MFHNEIYDRMRDDEEAGAWKRAALVVAMIMSIVSGLAAFAYLTEALPRDQKVSRILQSPSHRTTSAPGVADNQQTARPADRHRI